MSEGRRRREPFREQQDLLDRLALSELLDGAPFVEEARRGADDVFADRFKQKVHRFRHPREFGADGHDECARLLNDAPGPPVGVREAMAHRRLRVKSAAHRFDAFLPGVVVEHEIAQMRMTFEAHAEQILRLPLVPVRRVNPLDNAGEYLLREGRAHQHVHPAGSAFAVKHIAQLPLGCAFLDDQTGETEIPFLDNLTAHLGEHRASAAHFARRGRGVEACTALVRASGVRSHPSVRCGSWVFHLVTAAAASVKRSCSGLGM